MSELYWLGVLGNLNDLGGAIAVLSFLVFIALGFWFFLCSEDDLEPSTFMKKMFKGSMFAIVLGVVMAIFIPSQKNLLIIYGVGGTIDYLKENKDANKIPDKCIKALDKYLDDALNEDKDKDKE
jgi:hypothetical protein